MKDTSRKKIENSFTKWVKEMPCPLCMGVNSTMSTHPSLSKQQFEMSIAEPLKCGAGHLTSVLAFNNRELFLISVMDVNTRPVRERAS